MKSRISLSAVVLLVLSLTITGVHAQPAADTAAAHGIELPGETAALLPFPAGVTVGGQRTILNTRYVNFTFSAPWPEVLEFFSTRLARDGWEIVSEELPEQTTGARQAAWRVSGHGVDVSLSLETFGRPEGQNSVGVLQVRPTRD
ncbi:MAG: hypothetical protein JJT93_14440 [Gammaproteobacteria bacterium]|nr:hypothetical protein [Gammaproteobacteria bacterium]TVQ44337.1 MAG: hypothetical protein EA371_13885 [Gammaproteobacteria bacterium]